MKSVRLLAAFALIACTSDKPAASFDATPGVSGSRGDITWNLIDEIGSAARADLAAKFGATNLVDTLIYLVEGEMQPGSVLFPADSIRRVEITWLDSGARARPATIHLNGPASVWKLPHDITLGTTLAELERLNGKPFTVMGFGWDYGGTVTDWRGGSLSGLKSGSPTVFLRLSPQGDGDSPDHSAVLGENEFASDLAAMKRLNPIVDRIVVSYEGLGAN